MTEPAAQPPKPQPAQPGVQKPQSPMVKAMHKLGLLRDIDLALHLPLRYEDETRIVRLRDCRDGDAVQIEATVTSNAITQRPRPQLVVTVDDGSDTCTLRFFNFYPALVKALAEGNSIRARGEIKRGFLGWQMVHPICKPAAGDLPDALTPVYPSSAKLPQAYLRKAVLSGLVRADLSETVPEELGKRLPNHAQAAWTLRDALAFLHRPSPQVSMGTLEDRSHPAWQRLKAEELLAQQLSQLGAKRERDSHLAPKLVAQPEGLPQQLLAALPFALTHAQARVTDEITADLARAMPMNRLLQGDVGSGKTVVAALAAATAIDSGFQCALMVPTEILAEQHFRKLILWLEPLLTARGLHVAWLTGSQKKGEREKALAVIESGQAALVVGTHAVIQSLVRFKCLALVIIDEQHRFGVEQRLALRETRPGRSGSSCR